MEMPRSAGGISSGPMRVSLRLSRAASVQNDKPSPVGFLVLGMRLGGVVEKSAQQPNTVVLYFQWTEGFLVPFNARWAFYTNSYRQATL